MDEVPQPHPFTLQLATRLLAKAESAKGDGPVRLKLDRREAPDLHAQTELEAQQRLMLLVEELCASGWVALRLAPPRAFAALIDRNPQLELLDFDALAAWAGYTPQAQRWQRQWLAHLASRWAAAGSAAPQPQEALLDYLARSPLSVLRDLPLADATECLDTLHALCRSGVAMPLREASARVFHGRSKVLDHREELLRLLGAEPGQFHEAPIQLLLDIPRTVGDVLFIENLVTFERMADARAEARAEAWQDAVLIYAAGFKGSARRLRQRPSCRLYLRVGGAAGADGGAPAPACVAGLAQVQAWLFDGAALPVHFFGDLDYAGMHILRSLREGFADAQAWRPGYGALAQALRRGDGHTPEQAHKELQADPGQTGCAFADQELLPLLRECGRFMDQEVFGAGAMDDPEGLGLQAHDTGQTSASNGISDAAT